MVATREIVYQADGRRMIGTLALPDGSDHRAAVLIAHEGPGLDQHAKDQAERLAGLGYVAFALDYNGEGRMITDRDAMMARLGELAGNPERVRQLGAAGLQILLDEPRTLSSKVAAIGYCFGGTLVLELARMGADLQAVVGFHAGLSTTRPEDARNIRAKVLVCIGAEDPIVPADQRRDFEAEMRAGGVDWQMHLYGGAEHSFTHPRADLVGIPGIKYHEPSDRRSWTAMLNLFDEVLS
jgi:dienelactone hydrolase